MAERNFDKLILDVRKAQDALRGGFGPVFRMLHDGQSRGLTDAGQSFNFTSFLDAMRYQFDTRGARGGAAWAGYGADEARYARWKERTLGSANPLLRFIGGRKERLHPSFTKKGHPEHVFRSSANHAEMGSSVPYARDLDTGTATHRGSFRFGGKFPARPIISMTEQDMHAFGAIAMKYAFGGIYGSAWPRWG